MITKNKLWNIIVREMKTKHHLDNLTQEVMKRIEELGTNNDKSENK